MHTNCSYGHTMHTNIPHQKWIEQSRGPAGGCRGRWRANAARRHVPPSPSPRAGAARLWTSASNNDKKNKQTNISWVIIKRCKNTHAPCTHPHKNAHLEYHAFTCCVRVSCRVCEHYFCLPRLRADTDRACSRLPSRRRRAPPRWSSQSIAATPSTAHASQWAWFPRRVRQQVPSVSCWLPLWEI